MCRHGMLGIMRVQFYLIHRRHDFRVAKQRVNVLSMKLLTPIARARPDLYISSSIFP